MMCVKDTFIKEKTFQSKLEKLVAILSHSPNAIAISLGALNAFAFRFLYMPFLWYLQSKFIFYTAKG